MGGDEKMICEKKEIDAYDQVMFNRVKNVILKEFGSEDVEKLAKKLTPETLIFEELGADSLDRIELEMALEEEFAIEVLDEDMAKLKTLGDVAEMVQARVEAKSIDINSDPFGDQP